MTLEEADAIIKELRFNQKYIPSNIREHKLTGADLTKPIEKDDRYLEGKAKCQGYVRGYEDAIDDVHKKLAKMLLKQGVSNE